MVAVLVAVAAVVLVAALVVVVRRRRTPDTVASFQRQIDALSAEARRPVVDQVKRTDPDEAARRGVAGSDAGAGPAAAADAPQERHDGEDGREAGAADGTDGGSHDGGAHDGGSGGDGGGD